VGIEDDVLDVIIAHRMKQFEVNHRDELGKHFPAELLRRLYPSSSFPLPFTKEPSLTLLLFLI